MTFRSRNLTLHDIRVTLNYQHHVAWSCIPLFVLTAEALGAKLSHHHLTNPAHTIISEDLNPCLRSGAEQEQETAP